MLWRCQSCRLFLKNLCQTESDACASSLRLYIFVTPLMSLDGIFSPGLALRLLHSSHLLNRKCLCSSEGMCLLIPQLQPLCFEAMCPNALLLPCSLRHVSENMKYKSLSGCKCGNFALLIGRLRCHRDPVSSLCVQQVAA